MLAHADGGKRCCPPSILIALRLEARPEVYIDSVSDSEYARLRDWVDNHPDLRELLDLALAVRESWERVA
jgi:hypothetical protein